MTPGIYNDVLLIRIVAFKSGGYLRASSATFSWNESGMWVQTIVIQREWTYF